MPLENEVSGGYSQHTAGANGLLTRVNVSGLPNVVLTAANTFETGCEAYQRDSTTGYETVVWIMTGTPAAPAWTLDATGTIVKTRKVTLTSSQILALNTTAITLIPSPLAGQAIQVMSVFGKMHFLTAAYAAHTELDIIDTTSGTKLFEDTGTLLGAVATLCAQVEPAIAANAANVVTQGGSVSAKVATGNPTTGAGSLDLYITYKLITL